MGYKKLLDSTYEKLQNYWYDSTTSIDDASGKAKEKIITDIPTYEILGMKNYQMVYQYVPAH